MKLNFDDIRNKEQGKIGIVCGTGASLKKYHEEFEKLSKTEKDKYCFISCNEWHEKTKIDVDYWVIANNVFTVEKNYSIFNSKNALLIFADSVDATSKEFAKNNLTIDYISYDERHFKEKLCKVFKYCCNHMECGRKTIQEYIQYISKNEKMYSSCGTVGIHLLAVSVILGCNPIYISGIDMDLKLGYVDGVSQSSHGSLFEYSDEFGIQAKIIVDSAKKLGIEIIQLSELAKYDGIKMGEFIKK